jgi:glycosyltransferase involved in cell wall biosynthesis
MGDPLVSVLMTAYNREKYIAEAIESVLAQTVSDFEIIIVDDSSTDRSHGIAFTYARKDPRVRVYRNEKNLGDYPNRNRAAELARGKYLKYLDADDYIYPERLGVMVSTMERFPESGFGLEPLAQDDQRPYPFQISPAEAYRRHYLQGDHILARSPLGSIIRTSAFRQVGGFSGKRWVGDFELWHTLAARFPVVMLTKGGTWYRKHDDQESTFNRRFSSVRFEYDLVAFAQLSSKHCPMEQPEKEVAMRRIIRAEIGQILRCAFHGSMRDAWKLFRSSDIRTYVHRSTRSTWEDTIRKAST